MLSQGAFLDEYLFFLLTFEMRIPPVKLQEPCWKYNNNEKKTTKQKKKAVMTFSLVTLSTESKGGISPRSTVADTHLRACELCGGQPLVGLCESERQSRPFRSTQLSVVVILFYFFFFAVGNGDSSPSPSSSERNCSLRQLFPVQWVKKVARTRRAAGDKKEHLVRERLKVQVVSQRACVHECVCKTSFHLNVFLAPKSPSNTADWEDFFSQFLFLFTCTQTFQFLPLLWQKQGSN